MNRLIFNNNKEKTFKILEAIYNNDGYCPCAILKNEDKKCPCIDMMKNQKCHCGLFIK